MSDSSVLSPVDMIWDSIDLLEVSSVVWSFLFLVLWSVSKKLFELFWSPGGEFVQTHLEAMTIVLVVDGNGHGVLSEDSESELVFSSGSV